VDLSLWGTVLFMITCVEEHGATRRY